MRRVLLLLGLLLALAVPAAAYADEGMGMGGHEENPAQTRDALSLQALAILEQGQNHEQAVEKLDAALASDMKGAADLRAIRAAHAALHREEVAAAKRLLQRAFPAGRKHLVGLTFRPRIGTAGLVVGVAGGLVVALAAVGLSLRRRAERRADVAETIG